MIGKFNDWAFSGKNDLTVSIHKQGGKDVEADVEGGADVEEGGADRSYGIQVARLAGLPSDVIARAQELLAELEGTHSGGGKGLGRRGRHRPVSGPPVDQLSFFRPEHPVMARLRTIDIDGLTPREALNLLAELRRELGGS